MPTPGTGVCDCSSCQNGIADSYAVIISGTTNNTCLECDKYNGLWELMKTGPCAFTGAKPVGGSEVWCGFANFISLSFGNGPAVLLTGPRIHYEMISDDLDCLSPMTLNLVLAESDVCNWPGSISLQPIGWPLTSIGDIECLKRCPCEPLVRIRRTGLLRQRLLRLREKVPGQLQRDANVPRL